MEPFTISITPPDENEAKPFSLEQHVNNNNNNIIFLSLEDEIKSNKKPRDIYMRELGKINQFLASHNKELRSQIEQLHALKKELCTKKQGISHLNKQIASLTDKQKQLLHALAKSNQDEPKLQKEIQALSEEIKKLKSQKTELNDSIKHLNEENIYNALSKKIDLLKEKKNSLDMCINNFEIIKENTYPLIKALAPEKEAVVKLEQDLKALQDSSNKDDNIKQKCKEEINKSLTEAYHAQESLLNECENLRIALDEKMKQTIALNHSINKCNNYLELIDKYGEKYIEIAKKQKEFDEQNKKFTAKQNEYEDVIKRIDTFNKKYTDICDNLHENISTMENFINIEIIQREQINNYDEDIAELKNNIEINDEKIELLDLENKAIEAEIIPCELKITKYESEKKIITNQMKFEELPTIVNKIKELNKEKEMHQNKIKKIQDEISKFEAQNMQMLNEIENKRKLYVDIDSELRSEKIHYIKCYENVINELPEHLKVGIIQDELKMLHDEEENLNDEFGDDENTNTQSMQVNKGMNNNMRVLSKVSFDININ
jgi:chromosome segregation ATPase